MMVRLTVSTLAIFYTDKELCQDTACNCDSYIIIYFKCISIHPFTIHAHCMHTQCYLHIFRCFLLGWKW